MIGFLYLTRHWLQILSSIKKMNPPLSREPGCITRRTSNLIDGVKHLLLGALIAALLIAVLALLWPGIVQS